MREVQGYPLPLGVQISENKINFSIAVPTEKKCQLLIYRAGRKRLYRQFEMETAVIRLPIRSPVFPVHTGHGGYIRPC